MSTPAPRPDPTACFDENGRFVISDFQRKRPFSSFLPGIAGLHGIPMWVFYVNRGQAICSFGVESKDHPILEFQAANKAYQSTPVAGFRTFLNGSRSGSTWQREAFSPWQAPDTQRSLFTGMNEVEIQEVNVSLGYQINVLYFLLPNEPFAGLIRLLTIKNLTAAPLALEVLDGLPGITPYGVDNGALKHIGRTIEAWMQVDNLESRLPFYRLKATPGDTAEVAAIPAGNYAFAFSGRDLLPGKGSLLPVIADPVVVFGQDTSFSRAHHFHDLGLANLFDQPQTLEGRTPCAFFGAKMVIASGESGTITSLYGFAGSQASLQSNVQSLNRSGYIDQKLNEARSLAVDLTDAIKTESASPVFDAYCRQTFLDNVLRGGYPLVLGSKQIYHVYSRKHGDIERDYNYFVLAPEFYAQGNGNYRDVNQNRRSDVFFVPQAGLSNIRLFMSLIQPDGYNPLVIQGVTFSVPSDRLNGILSLAAGNSGLAKILQGSFTPGELYRAARDASISIPLEDFMHQVFSQAEVHNQAEHGEGYWIDHWTYNLDLIEAYLAVYPDQKFSLLFEAEPLPFFDSAHYIRPRRERFVLSNGKPRQLNAVAEDPHKAALVQSRLADRHWARAGQGQVEVFRLPLVSKLALLAVLKFAALDPSGMGIQLEAGRPGWYDALNGLPGLFGSSLPETCELLRLVNFLGATLAEFSRSVLLPVEAQALIEVIGQVELTGPADFSTWDRLTGALEAYRASVRMGFDGGTITVELSGLFAQMRTALEKGIKKANTFLDGIPPTYFIHEVTGYTETGTQDEDGRPHIQIQGFKPVALPAFLEGPVRQMKVSELNAVRHLHAQLRQGDLLDRKLGMYKVNASLESQPHEIGRTRAFTPGWLENESIWMHMAFKYLLELQKAGLNEEFFSDLQIHLPAFMDPEVYGRSPLENASFVVSSAHPDASLHGNGFVARLSGSTAEFLQMWVLMTAGRQPFRLEKGELILEFQPSLPGWMFKEDGTFSFRFLSTCDVTLHNPARKDTYAEGLKVSRIILHSQTETINLNGSQIKSPYADGIRRGEFEAIDLFFGQKEGKDG